MLLQPLYDLSEALDGREVVSLSVGVSGGAVLLATREPDLPLARLPAVSSDEGHMAARPYDAAVLLLRDGVVHQRQLQSLQLLFPIVQPLGDEVLVVGARSEILSDGPESNAAVFGR